MTERPALPAIRSQRFASSFGMSLSASSSAFCSVWVHSRVSSSVLAFLTRVLPSRRAISSRTSSAKASRSFSATHSWSVAVAVSFLSVVTSSSLSSDSAPYSSTKMPERLQALTKAFFARFAASLIALPSACADLAVASSAALASSSALALASFSAFAASSLALIASSLACLLAALCFLIRGSDASALSISCSCRAFSSLFLRFRAALFFFSIHRFCSRESLSLA